jgi:hypothetical protein
MVTVFNGSVIVLIRNDIFTFARFYIYTIFGYPRVTDDMGSPEVFEMGCSGFLYQGNGKGGRKILRKGKREGIGRTVAASVPCIQTVML